MKLYQWAAAAACVSLFACSASSEPDTRVVNAGNWPEAVSTQSSALGQTFATGEGMWQSPHNLCMDAGQLTAGSIVRMQLCDPTRQEQRWTIISARGLAGGQWSVGQVLTNSGFILNGTLGQNAHLDVIPSVLARTPYDFSLDHQTVHHIGEDACMDAGPEFTPLGTPVTFTPCHHLFGQIWIGFGGYNVAVTNTSQSTTGVTYYASLFQTPLALLLQQRGCTGGSTGTRCTPPPSAVLKLTPFVGSYGATVQNQAAAGRYWFNDPNVQGPVQLVTSPQQLWASDKYAFGAFGDNTNPGPGIIQTADANGNSLCSAKPNTEGGVLQMVNPIHDPNLLTTCDWSWVYQSK